ncbi:DUF3310 domain-containing protein [Staphylococcus pseudoxylosus]|uniref:DUF3310 domain-containing protein n=1 Tax=Staphylococcus pseudoxylosus TaxID=2282419 RepID=UPI000D1EB875|nr:DUF3310 domain-containing protein [Staphylococcus pseudoxylosus]MBM2657578.1 DUF3310 domain-containing protein [Staphylococcus pseudoxylosus]MEB5782422.1 DUF3310 domain-containing protein [Staphylococcus pseudoxylosus]PTI83652.1 hypothetical protein BU098_01855 [Staphylococcus xylosus]
MTQIHLLNINDIIEFEYPIDSGEAIKSEVTELHHDVMRATVYDGTETYHIDDKYKIRVIKKAENAKQQHYQSNTDNGIDLIDFWYMQMTPEEFQGAMKSNLMRYSTRLGRKDDRIKELKKIEDYARRYREKLEQEEKVCIEDTNPLMSM